MFRGVFFYRAVQELPGLYDTLFGGLFLAKTAPVLIQLGVLGLTGICVTLCAIASGPDQKRWHHWILGLVVFDFILMTLLVTQPWDELFVNLRHAKHFSEANTFSFNRLTPLEGTADFLPYFLLGCLGKLGFPLVEGALTVSLLGGLLLLGLAFKLSEAWGTPGGGTRAVVAMLFYPTLLFNSAQGFTASLFSAVVLGSGYYFFFTKKLYVALLLMAVTGLVRVEGIWWTALLIVILIGWPKTVGNRKPLIHRSLMALLVFTPAIFLALYRLRTFGSPIPLPVQYKSAFGSLFYFLLGLRNLGADLVAGYGFSCALVLIICRRDTPLTEKQKWLLGSLILFVTPYYLSGGDWFPPHWGRYLFPLSFALALMAWHALQTSWYRVQPDRRWSLMAVVVLLWIGPACWPQSAYPRFIKDLFSPRKTLATLTVQHSPHARIQLLSQLGNHLRQTTPTSAIIASSEVATVMYFAEREGIDLLGIANPEVVNQPLRVAPRLFNRYASSELPYSIFRRVNPAIVERHLPDIVYTFDFDIHNLYEDLALAELTDVKLFEALDRWHRKFHGLIAPIYGSAGHLLELGYLPVVVQSGSDFCNLYFVSEKAWPDHERRLRAANYTGGWIKRN